MSSFINPHAAETLALGLLIQEAVDEAVNTTIGFADRLQATLEHADHPGLMPSGTALAFIEAVHDRLTDEILRRQLESADIASDQPSSTHIPQEPTP